MMNKPSSIILCLVFALSCMAIASAQSAPDLQASDPQWGYLQDGYFARNTHFSSGGSDHGFATNNPPLTAISALFHNTGPKIIKSVTWEYLYFKDGQQTEVVAHRKFHSRKRIKPGASVRLKEYILAFSWPNRTTDFPAVRITRIKYADGTTWEAAKSKG
jgi:hypothetical protein